MTKVTYEKGLTGLLVIDPYNDFISEGGKIWDRIRGVAEANGCVPHMLQVLNAVRAAQLPVFYAMHRRYRPGDYESGKYMAMVISFDDRDERLAFFDDIRGELRPAAAAEVPRQVWSSSRDEQHVAGLDPGHLSGDFILQRAFEDVDDLFAGM